MGRFQRRRTGLITEAETIEDLIEKLKLLIPELLELNGHSFSRPVSFELLTVAIFASGSLSHRFNDNGSPEESMHSIWREFYRQVDLRVVELWKQGDWKTFCAMLPEYAKLCEGEGGMHDTAMLLGALGWDRYAQPVDVITDYFASSGTGQINAIFPVL